MACAILLVHNPTQISIMSTTSNICSKFFFFTVLLLLSHISPSLSERCHPNDKKALLKIKNALNRQYDMRISWLPEIDCCDWGRIDCDLQTNRVTTFDFSQVDLHLLPIPADIIADNLPQLESLSFHHANVSGPIPESLTRFKSLQFLDLSWNQLTGPVPSFLSQLKNLWYIGLSFNNLTGSIPPSLSQLPKLTGLLLDRNRLTGTIPESFGEFKAQEIYIYLSHNQLTGKIPESLGNAGFNSIDASRNQLEGDISFLYGRNKTIRNLDLSRNQLEFDFSDFVFPESFGNLNLNHNKIFGSLPQDLATFDTLFYVNVSYNRLCGKIPTGGRLQELDATAYFHNRCLCGAPLPDCKKILK